MGPLGPPEPLAPRHDVSRFSSGVPTLDAWLRGKARLNEAKGGARTYVVCDGDRVAGFCSLAAAGVVGARAIVVQAIDERAAAFCTKFSFRPRAAHAGPANVRNRRAVAGVSRGPAEAGRRTRGDASLPPAAQPARRPP